MIPVSKAVVTVLGIDCKGIIAQVSNVLWQYNVNILDISQTIVDGYFNMMMVVDITVFEKSFADLADELSAVGEGRGVVVHCQNEEIFEKMHRI